MGFVPGIRNDFNAKEADLDENNYQGYVRSSASDQYDTAYQQKKLADALMAQANGQGPSLAQSQFQTAMDQNVRAAAGSIASARGLNPAQQARLILDQQAMANQQAARGSGDLRMQEQMQARQQLGAALGQQRGQDQAMFTGAGGLQNQQNAARVQNRANANQINADVEKQNSQATQAVAGQVLGAAGTLAGMAHGGEVPGFADALARHYFGGGPVDDPRNDTVPAMLSPKEIVLPRSVTLAENAPERAKDFVEDIKSHEEEPTARLLRAKREYEAALEAAGKKGAKR